MEIEKLEKALERKIRFKSNKGVLSLEDLYDLSLEELDEIHSKIEAPKKTALMKKKSSSDADAELSMEILEYIFSKKEKEIEDRKNRLASEEISKKKKEAASKILEERQLGDLEKLSDEELRSLVESK